MQKQPTKKPLKKADQYNDPSHNYLHYWNHRDYEHQAEVLAIDRLLEGKHFNKAIDIGGGYGRLSVELEKFADQVVLLEPSQQQLDIADEFLRGHDRVEKELMQADDLKYADESVDLAIMIRVMHHLPDPSAEFKEIRRVLKPEGFAILEVANFMHGRNRVKYMLKGKRMPRDPVDIRSKKNRGDGKIAFVNHNPHTVIKQLAHAGLKVDRILSVSNLRSQTLKKVLPQSVMLSIEGILQPTLAKTYFGPSIFFLIHKAS
jgi:SAM-dependent methyltransferase